MSAGRVGATGELMHLGRLSVSPPSASIAVASLRRPLRLRWLLNALADQKGAAGEFEVIVAYDPGCAETAHLLASHPLAIAGSLRSVSFAPGKTLPGAGRNAAWPLARAELVLFTDDDCRPGADWVEQTLVAARANPGAILQGTTRPDPDEAGILRAAPWAQTVIVTPPTPWSETCNIAYPRALLRRLGGFAEEMRVGEDAELATRARAEGVPFLAAPEMVVYHAVEDLTLVAALRRVGRWRDLALLVKRHPEIRDHLWARIWWKREHPALVAAVAGAAASRRQPAVAVLALPWLALSMRHRGYRPRGLGRSLTELPGRAAIDAAELVTMVRGSIRYRTLLL